MKAAYYVIGALVLWIIFRECSRGPEPVLPTITKHEQAITDDKTHVAALEAQGSTISKRLVTDSIRHAEALQASESRISGLTKSLAAAVRRRPEVIRDTIYILQDSVIREQSTQITLLTHDRDTLRTNYARLLRIKESELRIKDEMFAHMEAINQELFKSLNKERRRSKLWKIAVPVALVVGFILGEEL